MKKSCLIGVLILLGSCQKEDTGPDYFEKWSLMEMKQGDGSWEKVKSSEALTFYFQTDSTLFVETDSLSCQGNYSVHFLNSSPYDKSYTVLAPCITPAGHMWWTYRTKPAENEIIEAIPRLNPTAFLSNYTFRFKYTSR